MLNKETCHMVERNKCLSAETAIIVRDGASGRFVLKRRGFVVVESTIEEKIDVMGPVIKRNAVFSDRATRNRDTAIRAFRSPFTGTRW